MARENSHQIRQLIAQQAARMMAEEGISDYAYAKKKAGKQLGTTEASHLPTNSEIAEEVKIYHELFYGDEQPEQLKLLRHDALVTMQMLEKFNPHLTGAVLDGTAGRYADTHLHLFADSLKEVEMFLLNKQIHFETNEKSYRVMNDGKRDKKSSNRKTVSVFTLEGPNGLIKLSVFEFDDMRVATKHAVDGANAERLNIAGLTALLT